VVEIIAGMRSPSARPEPRSSAPAGGQADPSKRRFGALARNMLLVIQNKRELLPNGGVQIVPHTVRFNDGRLETDDPDVIRAIERHPTYGDGIGGAIWDIDKLVESAREAELASMEKRLMEDAELRGRFLKRSNLTEFILGEATAPPAETGGDRKKK